MMMNKKAVKREIKNDLSASFLDACERYKVQGFGKLGLCNLYFALIHLDEKKIDYIDF
jgi:hypothetical protein